MSGSSHARASGVARVVNGIEETLIAFLLGAMTLLTFANVVVRYVFNSPVGGWIERVTGLDLPTEILWGLEVTLILFAWLVLYGISYGFKITAHLGVDAVLNMTQPPTRRALVIAASLITVVYALLLLKGAWDYWAPFAGLNATEGRWFPSGFANSRDQAWYETEQIPMPGFLTWMNDAFNEGEAYEKMPRFIPYSILPFGTALLVFRVIQVAVEILAGRRDGLIVSHEAEDDVAEVAARRGEA